MPVSPGPGVPFRCLSPHWGMQLVRVLLLGKLLWGKNHKAELSSFSAVPPVCFFSLKAALPSLYSHAS